MSRIGRAPVTFDDKVQVVLTSQNEVVVKSGKNQISVKMRPEIKAKIEGKTVVLLRNGETKEARSLHGMYRALIQNAVVGVTKGFNRNLELHGVGYRATVSGKKLELSLGFSHSIQYEIPDGIEIKVEKQTNILISGYNRAVVGAVAAKIRSFRPPEPYLGKGVRYSDEKIRRKAGKSAGK
jgi:large subunit ribosomal protein L6